MTVDVSMALGRMSEKINDLGQRIDNLYGSLHQENANKIEAITPYTATKTAYIGDTEITFYDTPATGNLTVYCPGNYHVDRLVDRIFITFDALEEVTEITISIL